MKLSELDPNTVLMDEFDAQSAYNKALVHVKGIYHGQHSADETIDILAPYLNMSAELSACSTARAQILYSQIAKGFEIASVLYSKAQFDLSQAQSELKATRAMYYLEKFPLYVQEMKAKGINIKDTDASREHYLNLQDEILAAKEKVDFFDAFVTACEGWKSKLFSDMTNARNTSNQKRYSDNLPTIAS